MTEKYKFQVLSWKEGKYYVARCLNTEVSSFVKTRKKALDNLTEALDLYIDEKHGPIGQLRSLRAGEITIKSTCIFNAERDNEGKGIPIDDLITMLKK